MKFKLYEYQWWDHYSTSTWKSKVPKDEDYIVYGVGFLVGEDRNYLHFSAGLVPSTHQYNGIMSVLKSALKSKKLIKVVNL